LSDPESKWSVENTLQRCTTALLCVVTVAALLYAG